MIIHQLFSYFGDLLEGLEIVTKGYCSHNLGLGPFVMGFHQMIKLKFDGTLTQIPVFVIIEPCLNFVLEYRLKMCTIVNDNSLIVGRKIKNGNSLNKECIVILSLEIGIDGIKYFVLSFSIEQKIDNGEDNCDEIENIQDVYILLLIELVVGRSSAPKSISAEVISYFIFQFTLSSQS